MTTDGERRSQAWTMSFIRITNPNDIRPVHVAMLGLLMLALAGNCLLTSAGKPSVLPDGAAEWSPDSILLALVEILDLRYSQATPRGVAVKGLIHGCAAGVGVLVAALGFVALSSAQERTTEADTVIDVEQRAGGPKPAASLRRTHLHPILTAQVLLFIYLLWSMASPWWSHAPQFARGGAILLATQTAWAYALAYGLNRRAATYGARFLLAVLFATALLAVAYHAERNPTLRASYPIGNPLFLAACLIPGLLLGITTIGSGGLDTAARRRRRGVLKIIAGLAAVAVLIQAFRLADSRGAQVGLAVGIAGLVFFTGNRKVRLAVAGITFTGLIFVGGYYYSRRFTVSPTGRSASMRVRFHAWNYALDLISDRPLLGYGEGGYALLADGRAAADVEDDPASLEPWLSHAHNEWLEIGADLGSVGLVLIGGALLLTLYGGARAIPKIVSRSQRWTMIALLSSLAALIVEECFNVGLRIVGLPLVFWTVVGLIWALARPVAGTVLRTSRHRWTGRVAAALSAAVCLTIVEYSRRDFAAARGAFDAAGALASGDWEKANSLAHRAFENRLSVQRKLAALHQEIAARLQTADALQAQYARRRRLAETGNVDPAFVEQAVQSRQESEIHVAAATEGITLLQTAMQNDMQSGWLEHGVHQILGVFAGFDGDVESAAKHQRRAADALRRQIKRQPYAPELAVRYVIAAEQLALPEAISLLARPLRIHPAPASYSELLGHLARTEGYNKTVVPVLDTIIKQSMSRRPSNGTDRWAPEKLRLGAMACCTIPDYEEAVRYLRVSTELYAALPSDASLATANSYAELAHALFFHRPDQPQEAVQAAETAVRLAPPSEAGRALCNAVGNRLVVYHLAADHEDFTRQLVRRNRPRIHDAELDRTIANSYVSMSYSVLEKAFREIPERLARWSARALQLAPQSAPPCFLAADLAIIRQDDEQAVWYINEAIRYGGDPADVIEIIKRGLQAMPDSNILDGAREHLKQQMQKTPPGTPTPPLPEPPS